MEKDSGEIFRELKKDVSAYVELKLELLKLTRMRERERLLPFSRMVLFYYFWLSLRFCSFSSL